MIRPPVCSRRRDYAVTARGAVASACFLGITAACGLLVDASGVARADGAELAASQAPAAPTGDSSATSVSAEAVGHAKEASERSTRLRAAGDETHARVADGLSHEWTETARDLELAVAAEKMAAERRREAMRAQAQLQRTRTLVEEGIARLGRIRAELGAGAPRTGTAVGAKP
jgi:hypothetical protein